MKYKIDELRKIAIGSARSILREQGLDPVTTPLEQIEAILCDYALNPQYKDRLFVQWINRASKHQWDLWRRDWRKWREKKSRWI